jgi:hypothetical protein
VVSKYFTQQINSSIHDRVAKESAQIAGIKLTMQVVHNWIRQVNYQKNLSKEDGLIECNRFSWKWEFGDKLNRKQQWHSSSNIHQLDST